MSNHLPGSAPGPDPHRRAAAVGGWTVAGMHGRVWLHHAWPAADNDPTPDAADALAAALRRAAVEARRPSDRSWTPSPQRRPP
jgi:hypothetical protein